MKGEILFSVNTFMGVRLLAYAAQSGINAKNVTMPDDHTLNVWVRRKDEKAFRALIEKFSLSYKVVSVRGWAKTGRAVKAHAVLAAGVAAGVVIIYLLSLRIWMIDLVNAPDKLYESIRRAGVFVGGKKSEIDVNAVSRLLEAEYPEYAHIGVRIAGVVLKVNCVKAEDAPEVYDIGRTRNLIAKTDGVVESVNVFAGQAQVKSGDTVFKGDVLILGQERAGKDGEVTYVRAEGSVTARVWTEAESAVACTVSKQTPTGRKSTVTEIRTPFFTRKLAGENPFSQCETVVRESRVVGLFFPVRLITTTYIETKSETSLVSENTARQIAETSALYKARQKAPDGAEEMRSWAQHTKQSEDTIAAKAVVEWIMEIAIDEQGG